MQATPAQKLLSTEQIAAFHHHQFVEHRTRHFMALQSDSRVGKFIVGVGDGCGFFARRLAQLTGRRVRVVDRDAASLQVNTFGVGVRFRAHDEWGRLFAAAGYAVKSSVVGDDERVSPVLRLLLIRHIRRDSFLLEPLAMRRA
jgi:hypothetical protein